MGDFSDRDGRAGGDSLSGMASGSLRRWRQLAVWLHVVTSVGWMAQAVTLCVLLTTSLTTTSRAMAVGATGVAELLDNALLAPLANASAFTGFLLAASTPWGYFRHWWLLVKFVVTVVQLQVGIFVLSDALRASAEAAVAGTPGPAGAVAVGAACMAGAIGLQAWLSVAKPWSTTPWTDRRTAPATAPPWVFGATVGAVLVDLTVAGVTGQPAPLASLVVLVTWLVARRRAAGRGVSTDRWTTRFRRTVVPGHPHRPGRSVHDRNRGT